MTEELTPEFETFSQMLDADEPMDPNRKLTDDERVLVDLRKVLAEDAQDSPLADSFAKETAGLVEERYNKLSAAHRLFDSSLNHFRDSVFRPSGLLKGFGLTALGFGLAAASFKALAVYGWILLLVGFGWLISERFAGNTATAGLPVANPMSHRFATGLFYALPLMAVCATALLSAAAIAVLGEFSISLRKSSDILLTLEVFVGAGIGVLLTKACLPYWRAYRARAASHPISSIGFQAIHAIWLVVLVVAAASSSQFSQDDMAVHWTMAGFLGLAVFLFVSVVSTRRYSVPQADLPDVTRALRTLVTSLALGFTPIGLALVVFYQMHLTREITDPSHEYVVRDVGRWVSTQSAIPQEQNGWVDLRHFLVREHVGEPAYALMNERLNGLSDFYDADVHSYESLTEQEKLEYSIKKKEFLAALPQLEAALDKPYYSPTAVEGFSFESQVPNYITYRSVSQGLSLLTQEAIAQERYDDALDHIDLALRWANKEESGSLITLMIKVAQLAITHENLEGLIVSGHLNQEQLTRLGDTLRLNKPRHQEYSETMKRETVLADKAMHDLVNGEFDAKQFDNVGLPPLMRFLPASYWESERKAYWNFHLPQASDWATLSNPDFDLGKEINPMNVTTQLLAPNTGRAAIQFCYNQSKYASLILMCELELYKLSFGEYPENLDSGGHTIDLMDTRPLNKKRPFRYERTEAGYILTSESPWYEKINLATRQVYGHDGKFEPNR
jgi:hypothetical protein